MYEGWKRQSYEGEVNGRKITELATHRIKQKKNPNQNCLLKDLYASIRHRKRWGIKINPQPFRKPELLKYFWGPLWDVMWKCWRAEPSLCWTKLLIYIVTRAIYAIRGQEGEGEDAAALGELHKVQEGLQLPSNSAGRRHIYLHKSQTIH